jgi:hypothetical protein
MVILRFSSKTFARLCDFYLFSDFYTLFCKNPFFEVFPSDSSGNRKALCRQNQQMRTAKDTNKQNQADGNRNRRRR